MATHFPWEGGKVLDPDAFQKEVAELEQGDFLGKRLAVIALHILRAAGVIGHFLLRIFTKPCLPQ
jgi:hypothetical protein